MNSISEIIQNKYSYQGVQDLNVYYDTFVFNLKSKKNSSNYNFLLIEKFIFDYNTSEIKRTKNGLVLNFGDTASDAPFFSNGNCFLGSFLDSRYKNVILVGIKQINNGTVPVIFSYNINTHSYKSIFPNAADLEEFNGFTNFNFKTDSLPKVNFINNKLILLFQSFDNSFLYANRLIFDIQRDSANLTDYKIYKYDKSINLDFNDIDDENIIFRYGDNLGIFRELSGIETIINSSVALTLDDAFSILSFDDNTVLGLDL
jgi:hypothetical protein